MDPVIWAVTLASETFELTLAGDGQGGRRLEVAGDPSGALPVSLRRVNGRKHLVTVGNRSAFCFIEQVAEGYKVVIHGHTFTAEVDQARLQRLRRQAAESQVATAGAEIRSPMPGLVLTLRVQPGELVEPGQGVVIIESMKMENEIKSPSGGRVAALAVARGEVVDKGALLLRLEPVAPEEMDSP